MPRQPLSAQQREYLGSIGSLGRIPAPPPPARAAAVARPTFFGRLMRSLRRVWRLRMIFILVLALLPNVARAQSDAAAENSAVKEALSRLEARLAALSDKLLHSTEELLNLNARVSKEATLQGEFRSRVGLMDGRLAEFERQLSVFDEQVSQAHERLASGEDAPSADTAKPAPPPRVSSPTWLSFEVRDVALMGALLAAGLAIVVVLLWPNKPKAPRITCEGLNSLPVPSTPDKVSGAVKTAAPSVAQLPAVLPRPSTKPIVGRPVAPSAAIPQGRSGSRASDLEWLANKAFAWIRPEREPRRVGFVTRTGNVRTHNEDQGLGFVINGRAVLVIGDGMGGLAGGAAASNLAVAAAGTRIIEIYGGAAGKDLAPASAAAVALGAAQKEIMREVAARKGGLPADGCRTTLIIVVVDTNTNSLGFAYIGDGGGCVRRGGGSVEHFVKPMKERPGSNAIYGSLGPHLDGELVSGSLTVRPGDLVLAGSDGVFDRVNADAADLAEAVAAGATQCDGNLQEAVSLIVDDFVNQRDEKGFLVDDNASLGAIAVGEVEPKVIDQEEEAGELVAASM